MITESQFKPGALLKNGDNDSLVLLVRKGKGIHLLWLDSDSFMFKVSAEKVIREEFTQYAYLSTLDGNFCNLLHKDFDME